jgi:hypothetical protein
MMQVEDDILSEVISCTDYHKNAPEFGERAWIAEGKEVDVVYWDEGNGWCTIMLLIPKRNKQCYEDGVKFYRKLNKAISKHYDGMIRIDDD